MSLYQNGAPPISELTFKKYDTDGDGSLDTDELHMAILDAGVPMSREDVEVAFRLVDTDGSGRIEFAEFERLWKSDGRFARLKRSEADMAVLRECIQFFRYYDTNGDRSLDRDEFARLHQRLVEGGYTKLSLDECLAALDSDKNGLITFSEYVAWMHAIGSIKLDGGCV